MFAKLAAHGHRQRALRYRTDQRDTLLDNVELRLGEHRLDEDFHFVDGFALVTLQMADLLGDFRRLERFSIFFEFIFLAFRCLLVIHKKSCNTEASFQINMLKACGSGFFPPTLAKIGCHGLYGPPASIIYWQPDSAAQDGTATIRAQKDTQEAEVNERH